MEDAAAWTAFLVWIEAELQRIALESSDLYEALPSAIMRWKQEAGPHQEFLALLADESIEPRRWLELVVQIARRVCVGEPITRRLEGIRGLDRRWLAINDEFEIAFRFAYSLSIYDC